MPIPKFTENTIRYNTTPKSLERGEACYLNRTIDAITLRGNILQAKVEGSESQPYRVKIGFENQGFTELTCTCAYSMEGWCKHVVATLLVCLRQPQKIAEGPTLEHLLNRLNHQQTQLLLQNLVAEQPELIDRIDSHITRIAGTTPSQQPSKVSSQQPSKVSSQQPSKVPSTTSINTTPYRSQVRQILRHGIRYLEDGCEEDTIAAEILDLIAEAQEFSQNDDANNALAILQSITETCIKNWDDVAEYGIDGDEIVMALDEAWTEAILCAEFTEKKQIELQENLINWQDEWDANFGMSLEALRQGWDYPPLKLVLQGNISERGAWEGEAPDYADDLALIRLQILDRQKRHQEYLYLAEAEGETQQYLVMLASLGRISEALSAAKTQMTSVEQAKALAFEMWKQGSKNQALEIAQIGFSLPGHCLYELATWTTELAEELGDLAIALNAKIQAFVAQPSFNDYRKVEELAGEQWSTIKVELLTNLRSQTGWATHKAKVDIFLHEGFIDEAIEIVTDFSSYDSSIVHQVMEAAISHRADWVIENACQRAESIVERGKADAYHLAVEWLHKARAAYLQSDRESEWSIYCASLIETHGRKRKFMGLLKSLN
ncbi:MAG: SWIM zinc finger domain-containing protein [Tychonema bourrellyi B0820]|nr:SWIM zinc finger domain-containing protein [Tychonema bourrellyi B0820]